MVCPKCNVVAAIKSTSYVVVGDKSPEEETKLYVEHKYTCRNPQCVDYSKIIGRKRNPIQLGKDEDEEA